jgi:hypothetical protein
MNTYYYVYSFVSRLHITFSHSVCKPCHGEVLYADLVGADQVPHTSMVILRAWPNIGV